MVNLQYDNHFLFYSFFMVLQYLSTEKCMITIVYKSKHSLVIPLDSIHKESYTST